VETLWQAQENNTTLTIWLLPRQIRVECSKKVRESEGSGQWLVVSDQNGFGFADH
jgi:hypothetical protein